MNDCLHFFSSPCESEVFKLINKNSVSTTNHELTTCNMTEVTSAITLAIKGLEGKMHCRTHLLVRFSSGPFNSESSSLEEDVNEMESQSQETE